MIFMTLWPGLWVWQCLPHPCGRFRPCCGYLASPFSVKIVNWNQRCAYNVLRYPPPPPPPLFDDIHDPVVGIMGVTALTTIQSLLWLAILSRMCKTGNLHPHLTTLQLNTILTPLPHPNTPNTTLTRTLCSSC